MPLVCPSFCLDGEKEPELAGLYVLTPRWQNLFFRVGFALGNEFSDHKMEKINYLYPGSFQTPGQCIRS